MAEPASVFDPSDTDAEEQALLEAEAQLDDGQGVPLADIARWLESWDTPNELPPPPWK